MPTQRERLMSRRPGMAEVPVPDPPRGYAVQMTVTAECDRCRKPVAVLKRAPLKLDRPYRVEVSGYGRRGAVVTRTAAGWSLACLRHRDGRRYGPVAVTAAAARTAYDAAVRDGRATVTLSSLA